MNFAISNMFKQKKKGLTMGKVIMSGTDLHDNSLVCRISFGSCEAVTKRYPNTAAGRLQLFGFLKGNASRFGCERIIVAYEASTQGFCLYDDCRDADIECFILAPTKMRKSKKDRKNKNDENDAQLILETLRGHILAGNKLPSIWIPDDQTRAHRETIRARLDLAHKLTAVKTQIQTLLKARRLKKPEDAGKSWTIPHRLWLASLCIDNSWSALATLLRQVSFLEDEISVLDKDVLHLSKTTRYAHLVEALLQLAGVGVLTAMVFLTEIGDLSRFKNRKQVGAFLGLVPSSDDSGEANDRKGHITREGPARLRRVLCQATWARVTHDVNEGNVYRRIVKRNPKHKKIAVVASMRRLGIRMWHVGLEAQMRSNAFNHAGSVDPKAA
jgi:transposase